MMTVSLSALILSWTLAAAAPAAPAKNLRGIRSSANATNATAGASPGPSSEAEANNCTDTDQGAADSEGYGCADYAAFPSYCVTDGAYDDSDFTLVDMCCACGAGAADVDVLSNCTDTDHGAADDDGYSCAWYSDYPSYCVQDGAYDDSDFTLVDMCCACGAGAVDVVIIDVVIDVVVSNCTDADQGATDVEGFGCADYSAFPSYCVQTGAYDDSDFTLAEMCCACGGGAAASANASSANASSANASLANASSSVKTRGPGLR